MNVQWSYTFDARSGSAGNNDSSKNEGENDDSIDNDSNSIASINNDTDNNDNNDGIRMGVSSNNDSVNNDSNNSAHPVAPVRSQDAGGPWGATAVRERHERPSID